MIEVLGSFLNYLLDSSVGVSSSLDMTLISIYSQHLIVALVDIQLHWVLVVSEQSVVSISQISQSSTQIERVLDWRGVVHWSEEMILKSQNDNLFKQLVTHQKLLARS